MAIVYLIYYYPLPMESLAALWGQRMRDTVEEEEELMYSVELMLPFIYILDAFSLLLSFSEEEEEGLRFLVGRSVGRSIGRYLMSSYRSLLSPQN